MSSLYTSPSSHINNPNNSPLSNITQTTRLQSTSRLLEAFLSINMITATAHPVKVSGASAKLFPLAVAAGSGKSPPFPTLVSLALTRIQLHLCLATSLHSYTARATLWTAASHNTTALRAKRNEQRPSRARIWILERACSTYWATKDFRIRSLGIIGVWC